MIGIICALKIEVDGLKALMENPEVTQKAGLEFTSGKIYGKDGYQLGYRGQPFKEPDHRRHRYFERLR